MGSIICTLFGHRWPKVWKWGLAAMDEAGRCTIVLERVCGRCDQDEIAEAEISVDDLDIIMQIVWDGKNAPREGGHGRK